MFYVSRNLAAFYNLRKNSAKPDISRNFCSASQPNFPKKIGLGVYCTVVLRTRNVANSTKQKVIAPLPYAYRIREEKVYGRTLININESEIV